MAKHTLNIEEILIRIAAGESQRFIAAQLNINVMTLNRFLNQPEHALQSARARYESAESWLDRGLDMIESSLSKSGDVDPSAARAYAQECARRAAVRNPQYRDKIDATIANPAGETFKIEQIRQVIVKPKGE